MLDRMKQMRDNASETSEALVGMVAELSEISDTSLHANQRIAEESETLLVGSTENGDAVEMADQRMQDITEQLAGLSEMNHRTSKLTDTISENTQENQRRMDDATASMEQNVLSTENGMESIQKANESATLITSSNEELAVQIHAIDKAAEIIREKSNEVADSMKQISDNTQSNCNAVEHVTAATQENIAGTENLVEIVEQIKGLSEQQTLCVIGSEIEERLSFWLLGRKYIIQILKCSNLNTLKNKRDY